jgi:hypothetical protein
MENLLKAVAPEKNINVKIHVSNLPPCMGAEDDIAYNDKQPIRVHLNG